MIAYKYRSMKRAECILKDLSLRFARPSELNDPFDCSVEYRLQPSHKESIDILVNWLHRDTLKVKDYLGMSLQLQKDLNESIIEVSEGLGVYSCSEVNDDILMWSHYANGHRGVVIGIDFEDEILNKVQYVEDTPLQVEVANSIKNSDGMLKIFMLRKSPHWAYEKEVRVVAGIPALAKGQVAPVNPVEIKEVIFGCETTENDKEEVLGWLKYSGAKPKLFEAEKSSSKYRIEIKEIK